MKKRPKYFILDVDGVLNDGKFLYSKYGKQFKVFGPHDHDGLKFLSKHIKIEFVTADRKGFAISKKRIVDDMNFKLKLVSEQTRKEYLDKTYGIKNIIYMGDGYFDSKILKESYYGIAPSSARIEAIKSADFVTKEIAGNGAVLTACLHIKKKFFKDE